VLKATQEKVNPDASSVSDPEEDPEEDPKLRARLRRS